MVSFIILKMDKLESSLYGIWNSDWYVDILREKT